MKSDLFDSCRSGNAENECDSNPSGLTIPRVAAYVYVEGCAAPRVGSVAHMVITLSRLGATFYPGWAI